MQAIYPLVRDTEARDSATAVGASEGPVQGAGRRDELPGQSGEKVGLGLVMVGGEGVRDGGGGGRQGVS